MLDTQKAFVDVCEKIDRVIMAPITHRTVFGSELAVL